MNTTKSDACRNLGIYVKQRRRALNLTQTELGGRLGWMQERVSILEHGKYGMPSVASLAALAQALNGSLFDLLVAAGYDMTPSQSMTGEGEWRPDRSTAVRRISA